VKEQQNLEYKERITKAFLKTVSAYANYNGGVIIFGINDDGDVVGIDDIKKECMRIENMINTSIEPVPRFSINVENIADKNITLQREFYFKYNQAFGFLISYVYGTHTHSSYCEDNNLSSLRPSQSLFHYQIEQR